MDEFEFGKDSKTDHGVSFPLASKNQCLHLFSVAIDPVHVIFEGNKDMHNFLDEFEFGISYLMFLEYVFHVVFCILCTLFICKQ